MQIIPAIDLREGKCVRLLQGDPDRQTVYSGDPVGMAKRFRDAGARLIHVVDLDGAFAGKPVNDRVVADIARSAGVPIEVGGGIRTTEAIRRYADHGISRIIVGTVILEESFRSIAEEFKELIVAGVDARNSMVATHGWKQVSDVRAMDVIGEIVRLGVMDVIYTDIATDGMLSGPNVGAIGEILSEVDGLRLIASGGISSMADLERLSGLAASGLMGCITGKAIYDGKIDLREAIARFG
ncbi:MAG: 1-(5-phosphoribosyl)-5-[(5-phosphoribosylamino)methylideneamino]imidazole-4-carboxamide isomerase [Spirochaetes bacterium]|nr:1-(5-phosphoribosyl)-5-[(5-phosphoribosylamino)methylideneamino]imidazole-4-carboxamide isomerase [Spirochaetota bacterium]